MHFSMIASISAIDRTPISAMNTIRVRGTPAARAPPGAKRRAPAGELKHRQSPGLIYRLEQPLRPRQFRRQPTDRLL